jgi:hypothetical protein
VIIDAHLKDPDYRNRDHRFVSDFR